MNPANPSRRRRSFVIMTKENPENLAWEPILGNSFPEILDHVKGFSDRQTEMIRLRLKGRENELVVANQYEDIGLDRPYPELRKTLFSLLHIDTFEMLRNTIALFVHLEREPIQCFIYRTDQQPKPKLVWKVELFDMEFSVDAHPSQPLVVIGCNEGQDCGSKGGLWILNIDTKEVVDLIPNRNMGVYDAGFSDDGTELITTFGASSYEEIGAARTPLNDLERFFQDIENAEVQVYPGEQKQFYHNRSKTLSLEELKEVLSGTCLNM
jgi:hypothetical protein